VIKVVMIGAGSVVFCRNLTGDILSYPEFRDATFAYHDIDADRLEVGAELCRKAAALLGANPKIEATSDRKAALAGADFVINMVQIGGFDSTLVDFEIPRRYGLNFTIADTTGPGGLMRALRTFGFLRDLGREMQEICPRAWLLNYANPMSMNMRTLCHTSGVKAVGLCHSVQGTFDQLMGYLQEDPKQVAFTCAGINHMAFYLKVEKAGVDLYPRLFEAMQRPEIYDTNRVRFEIMKRLGYFVTESSEHSAEYSSWFIPHGPEHAERFAVPIDEYLRRCDRHAGEFEDLKKLCRGDEPIGCVKRSHEYGSAIIHALVSGQPIVIYGNMPNHGTISNLPADAIVEAPTLVDRGEIRFVHVGDLPPQLVGYIQPHLIQHELFIRAALEGRRDHVYQACMFDPLTAATLTTDQIVQMCDELIAAHGDLLPPLNRPMRVPCSGKQFGKVDVEQLRSSWKAQKNHGSPS
jgi:alpha-galactosidase